MALLPCRPWRHCHQTIPWWRLSPSPIARSGRGRRLHRGLIASRGDELNVPVLQPTTFRDDQAVSAVASLSPEVIVVASYGRILPQRVLDLPERGALNLHPSLLPRHRGPSPIAGTILSDDAETGVSVMEMVAKMDAGPIVAQRGLSVSPTTPRSLWKHAWGLQTPLSCSRCCRAWYARELAARPQNENDATYTELLTKESGALDWSMGSVDLERRVRALIPWPVAFTMWKDASVRVFRALALPDAPDSPLPPGSVLAVTDDAVMVQTGKGQLALLEVQAAGGRRMSAAEFARGRPGISSARFSSRQ